MKKILMGFVVLPLLGYLTRMVVQRFTLRREQMAAREHVAPTDMETGALAR